MERGNVIERSACTGFETCSHPIAKMEMTSSTNTNLSAPLLQGYINQFNCNLA